MRSLGLLMIKEFAIRISSIRIIAMDLICPLVILFLFLVVKVLTKPHSDTGQNGTTIIESNITGFTYSRSQTINEQLSKTWTEIEDMTEDIWTQCEGSLLEKLKKTSRNVELKKALSVSEIQEIVQSSSMEYTLQLLGRTAIAFAHSESHWKVGVVFRDRSNGDVYDDRLQGDLEKIHLEYHTFGHPSEAIFQLHQHILFRLYLLKQTFSNTTPPTGPYGMIYHEADQTFGAVGQKDSRAFIMGPVFIFPLVILSSRILAEKQSKMVDLLRICGVSRFQYYLSYYVIEYILLYFYASCYFGLFPDNHNDESFTYVVVLNIYTVSSILFCMATTKMFSSPPYGVLFLIVAHFGSQVLALMGPTVRGEYFRISKKDIPSTASDLIAITLCAVMPPSFGFQRIILMQNDQYYVSKIHSAITATAALAFNAVLWANILLIPVHKVAARVCEFTKHKIMRLKKNKKEVLETNTFFHEQVPPELSPGIEIIGVSKRFARGKPALENVQLTLFYGQITVLLGTNGAGKTCLIHLMTGVTTTTEGRIILNCPNVSRRKRDIGMCPQMDVLYDDLTVSEHLHLFGLLKGQPWRTLYKEVNRVIEMLTLCKERYIKSKYLNGVSKRRLQLAIALVAGSKLLILDEPTYRMDVDARKSIWDLLFSLRKDCVIVVATNSVDETEWLGDRIAILEQGKLRCSGSALFLKRMFGHGYYLRVAKAVTYSLPRCRSFVRSFFRTAQVVHQSKMEVVFNFEEDESGRLGDFFEAIEENKAVLDIKSCSARKTALDDVALKISTMFDEDTARQADLHMLMGKLTLRRSVLKSSYAIICKRLASSMRSRATYAVFGCILVLSLLLYIFSLTRHVISIKEAIIYDVDDESINCNSSLCTYIHNAQKESVEASIFVTEEKAQNGIDGETCLRLDVKNAYDVGAMTLGFNILTSQYEMQSNVSSMQDIFSTQANVVGTARVQDPLATVFYSTFLMLTFIFNWVFPFRDILHDRTTKMKLLQTMTGTGAVSYWLSNGLFDFLFVILISFPAVVVQPLLYYFSSGPSLTHFESITTFYVAFSAVTLRTISEVYNLAWFVRTVYGAVLIVTPLWLGQWLIFMLAVSVGITHFGTAKSAKGSLAKIVLWFCSSSPLSQMSELLTQIYRTALQIQHCAEWLHIQPLACDLGWGERVTVNRRFRSICCDGKVQLYVEQKLTKFSFVDSSKDLISSLIRNEMFCVLLTMATVQFIVFIVVIVLVESATHYSCFSEKVYTLYHGKPSSVSLGTQDSNVREEEKTTAAVVAGKKLQDKALIVENLSKAFWDKFVVDHVSFYLNHNECFGLLGVNYCGKSTLFKMLVGEYSRSSGEVYSGLLSISKSFRAYRSRIGYSPESNVFYEKLTAKEVLYFFARLRGVQRKDLRKAVEDMIKLVDLQLYQKAVVENLSEGNKQKLSLGVALIGWPPMLFLDEPTRAVDPVSSTKICKVLQVVRASGRCSLLISSHSMYECESLCDRIAFMVAGKFAFIGSIQQLKERSERGYTILLKPRIGVVDIENIDADIMKALPSAKRLESYTTVVEYYISNPKVRKGYIYRVIENIKTDYQLDDYEVREPTLEEILSTFARLASESLIRF